MRGLRRRRGPLPRIKARKPRTNEQLERLGRNLGHYVRVVDGYMECDDIGAGRRARPWWCWRCERWFSRREVREAST